MDAVVARAAKARRKLLAQHCEDCLTGLYVEALDLPAAHTSCQLRLPQALTPTLERLRAALADRDPDRVADELPGALAEVDGPPARAALARAVLALEAQGRCRPEVAAAALDDLAADGASAVVLSSLLASLGAPDARPRRRARPLRR